MTNLPFNKGETQLFSYHKSSGYVGFIGAMVFVMILESVGVSFLLYKWSPILHWIHLILALLTIVFLLLDLNKVTKNPIKITEDEIILKIGIQPKVSIEMNNVKEIKKGNINYENDRKNKEVLDLSLLGFEEPSFELVLISPIEHKSLVGKSHQISRIFFTVDDRTAFYNTVMAGIEVVEKHQEMNNHR